MPENENAPRLQPHTPGQPEPGQLEKEEAWLWRLALLFLVLLATALAAVSWDKLAALPYHLVLVPIAILCTVILFAGFAYGRRKRVAELKILLRGVTSCTSFSTNPPQTRFNPI